MHGIAGDAVTADNLPNLRARDGLRSESSLKHGHGGRGLWTNPEEFNPSRWLTEDGKFNPKAGFSNPFGMGIRSCAGKALAVSVSSIQLQSMFDRFLLGVQQLEIKLVVATLNLAFFFEEVPKELSGWKPVLGISRAPEKSYVAPRLWRDDE